MAEADPQTTFNVQDAKTNLSQLMDRARAGEEIVLAKAGKPWVRIMPLAEVAKPRRKPGGLRVTGEIPDSVWFDPLPEEELRFIDDRPAPR